jgi:hypothetical protein
MRIRHHSDASASLPTECEELNDNHDEAESGISHLQRQGEADH